MKTFITADDYLFDYIHLISLAFPEGDIWTETLADLSTEERIELMGGVTADNKITYFGVVFRMTPENMLDTELYNWHLFAEGERLDMAGGI